MDLNYLYHRHQVSLHLAENALCERTRDTHRAFAAAYAERIARMKAANAAMLPA